MSKYIENPKLKGSGLISCIPQEGKCPIKCLDCFFQSGRSYLEPLENNVPNMPKVFEVGNRIVRVNDGNDSNNNRELVLELTKEFPLKFYNTSIPLNLNDFREPVVLTINPSRITDIKINKIIPPKELMFVRLRTNTWNTFLIDETIEHYTKYEVPIILTFMAYYTRYDIPDEHLKNYIYRKRTLNSYYAITTKAWEKVIKPYKYNKWIYTCGKIEGEKGITSCRFCGNCIREYYATIERMKK